MRSISRSLFLALRWPLRFVPHPHRIPARAEDLFSVGPDGCVGLRCKICGKPFRVPCSDILSLVASALHG